MLPQFWYPNSLDWIIYIYVNEKLGRWKIRIDSDTLLIGSYIVFLLAKYDIRMILNLFQYFFLVWWSKHDRWIFKVQPLMTYIASNEHSDRFFKFSKFAGDHFEKQKYLNLIDERKSIFTKISASNSYETRQDRIINQYHLNLNIAIQNHLTFSSWNYQ